ncbi:ammonium transporter [Roseimicrobium sp. ORNL1]|uniref:ammonium transporter n=1 Tax=Roseimicrobium sp. ORNL1 TaxID=2711231 RepID=UPI00197D5BB4|nr:ammonium transporter [Roseimicrobium sp. ORNL1]
MTRPAPSILATLVGMISLSLCLQAQAQSTTTDAEAAPQAPSNYRIIIAEPQTPSSAGMQDVEKRLDHVSKILETMAETMAAKGTAPASTAAAAEPAGSAAPTAAASSVTAEMLQIVQDHSSYVWALLGGILVFNMQAGFAMLELGVCRAKNSINVLMKNYLDFCIGSIVYLLIGFNIQFGSSWMGILGLDSTWLPNFGAEHKVWVFWFFQVGFASVACTIVSGAIAERTKFMGYLIYSALFTVLIYPITGHWAWGGAGGSWGMAGDKGWLEAMGFIDFAGSSVVHACGGACALAGVIVVGPRVGRFAKDGTPRIIAGHNLPLAALGALLLWFGWFGFNAGSTLAANDAMGRIAVNTLISPSAGAVFAMIAMWLAQGKSDVGIAINGSLGGAVGITACCANISPASALVVGAVAGLLTTGATILLERLRLDDVAGAVPVHLVNGLWGTLSVALFDEKGFDAGRLGVQALGTFSVAAFSFVAGFAIFKLIDLTVGLRASEEEQLDGLDFSEHAVNAYPDFQTSERA